MSTRIIHFFLLTVMEMEAASLLFSFMQIALHKTTIVLISFILSFSAFAKEITLFNELEEAASNYNSLRKSIEPGDTLVFSKNISFKVNALLGCGEVTCIYELADYPDQALRIPRTTGIFVLNLFNTFYFENFIDYFIEGKKLLDRYQIPSVQIYESQRLQFVRVEKIDPITDLTIFLHHPYSFSSEERFKMEADLIDFARRTSLFSSISDFNSKQLHYVKNRGWILLDWSQAHQLFSRQTKRKNKTVTVFDNIFSNSPTLRKASKRLIPTQYTRWLRQLHKKINLAVNQERNSCTGLFNQLQAETN